MSKSNGNAANDLSIPVGIDLGSLYARVAVSNNHNEPRIVSNTLGHRSTLACTTKEDDHIVMGEAAQRLLHKHKQDTCNHTIYALLQQNEEEDNTNNEELCQSFMGHLASLASDATSVQPSQLRVVLSVPAYNDDMTESLVDCTKQGIRALVKKQSSKKKINTKNIIVGVLTNPAAVCVAHGLADKTKDSTIDTNNQRVVVVVDWGASGMTVTCLEFLGTSRILSMVESKCEESLSGAMFLQVFAKHVALQFERKNKIPTGEVWQSFKARNKLLVACQVALKSMTSSGLTASGSSSSSSVHVTIDGLYEGIDCHTAVSRPRWDMLTSSLLQKVNTILQEFFVKHKPQVVLSAGSVSLMPSAQKVIDKVCAGHDVLYRGIPNIPPDEAVALGCARHAKNVLQVMDTSSDCSTPIVPSLDVPTSPIALGLRQGNDGDGSNTTVALIDKGTPLPAHVSHTFVNQASETYTLWQLTPAEKLIAKLEDLASSNGEVELLIELSEKGSLSLAVQGGEVVRL